VTGQAPPAADSSASGVRWIDYSFDNFATFTRVAGASAPVVLTQPVTIAFRAIDWAGNVSGTVTRAYNVNRTPVAMADAYSTPEDTALVVAAPGVLNNDLDADDNTLTAILVSAPSHGALTLDADGSFTYTPDANYHGPDSLTYKANDGLADSDMVAVSITVNAVNDPPVAENDSHTIDEDVALHVPAPGVLGNDTDVDSDVLSLTAVLETGPAHGTLTPGADGSFVYMPDADFHGSDAFTYRASDGSAASNLATVTITVNPVPDAPVAADDAYATNEDTALSVPAPGVLGNDADVDQSALAAILVSGPSHGALTLNPNGSFTYTPDADYSGPDSFSYQANDGIADSNIATVVMTVNAVNDAPVAVDDAYPVDEDTVLPVAAPGVLSNDSDIDSDPLGLTAILVAAPAHGTLVLNADGSFAYTPHANFDGSDTFTYRANDGSAAGNVATVTITVTPINDPPSAANDFASTPYATPVVIAVLANDSASDAGDTLAIQSVSNMVGGIAVANLNGTVTFTPAPGFSGAAGFSYTAVDSGGLTATADVTVTVGPANIEPICTDAFANADLWPPNHKAVYVTVGGVVDPEGFPIGVTFTSILQDEPTNSVGQGNTMQDGGIELNGARAWVRAERSGTKKVPGDGRVYLIGFTATDAGGLTCTGTVRVDVPHDQRGTPATLSPGRWNSLTGAPITTP
jgi:VCBS repeat-containing protein